MKNRAKPTIAFFGSSLISAYWNGAATYYRGIIKYLHRLGYNITFYEPDAFDRHHHIDLPDPGWARIVIYQNDPAAVKQVIGEASGVDILIKASGVGVFDAYLENAVLSVKKPNQLVIFWDVDAPATLDSVLKDPDADFRKLIPMYDFIFTYGGGQPVVDAYLALNARECIPVYNALDPETHFRVPAVPEYLCDLAFLGNRLPDREARVYEFFINVAEKLPEKKFLLGGSGWESVRLPENVRYIGHVYTADHNAFNSSPGMVLNISRQSMADYGFSPATRVFEAAGAGACIITDHWNGIEKFFSPSSEILVASDGEVVITLLESMSEEQMKKTGQAALAKVLAEHTYERRAVQVSNILLEGAELESIQT
jgi:spore maturation protein CgeB